MPERTEEKRPRFASNGALALMVRLTWMAYGNIAVALLAVLIVQARDFSALDVAFWGVVGTMVSVRYVDVTRFGGLTAEGEPASIRHWRRYASGLVGVSLLLWMVVHALGRWL